MTCSDFLRFSYPFFADPSEYFLYHRVRQVLLLRAVCFVLRSDNFKTSKTIFSLFSASVSLCACAKVNFAPRPQSLEFQGLSPNFWSLRDFVECRWRGPVVPSYLVDWSSSEGLEVRIPQQTFFFSSVFLPSPWSALYFALCPLTVCLFLSLLSHSPL